ncbi:MAG: acetaldehyde dehydrogenase (acetylating) [Candidatus Limiplasma sp.]|nr:acetaldehyde dehydrogenase (acetylating) [Candidatus Limiplasma sp.]
MELDRDLASIQEVRDLTATARKAQATLATLSQQQIDTIVLRMTEAAEKNAEALARMAVEDTGFGVLQDKVVKNLFASRTVYESIRTVKSIGIIGENREKHLLEAAVPVGVVAGLVPSTNPTSTTIFKSLISVKAGNAIIFSPHPSAVRCITETVRILTEAACAAGAPEGILGVMSMPTLQGTQELMKRVNLILATGGTAMVKAAYSSGTPALGVGPGNVPAYIERTADIPNAVRRIMASKTFDNGTICASEQSVVTEACIRDEVIAAFKARGGAFVSGEDAQKIASLIRRPGADTVNPRIVGQSALKIAEMAGVRVPADTRVILCEQDHVGPEAPFSMEKLSPLLAFYTEQDWRSACERCLQLLRFGGLGHSLSIHTQNEELVRTFLTQKPVSRLLVNTGSTQGGIGATTGIMPSLTLGCGAVGGSATSDNVTVYHMFQIRRAAWGLVEPEAIAPTPAASAASPAAPSAGTSGEIDAIVEAVLRQLRNVQ